jgi:hypothetical protein
MANEVTKVNTPAPALTMEQLLQLFMDQQRETAASNKALAEALLESRKPYIDPKVLAEREQMRKDRKALVDQTMRDRRLAKQMCPHINEGGKLNIKWHQHSNGIILGVCGSCKSEFDATRNREDALLFRQDPKAAKNMARAGEHARRGVEIAL